MSDARSKKPGLAPPADEPERLVPDEHSLRAEERLVLEHRLDAGEGRVSEERLAAQEPLAPDEEDEWDRAIEAWSASLPVLDDVVWSQSPQPVAPLAPPDVTPGAVPEEEASFFETPTTAVSQGLPPFDFMVLSQADRPEPRAARGHSDDGVLAAETIADPFAGRFTGPLADRLSDDFDFDEGAYVALVATEERPPNIFLDEPPLEEPPPFPTDVLPEMAPAPWRDDVTRLVQLRLPPAAAGGEPAYGTGPAESESRAIAWEDVGRMLEAERSLADGAERRLALALAHARVLEQQGRLDAALAAADAAVAADAESVAAHRARLCLAERLGRAGQGPALDSVAALARLSHADEAYYRLLQAEWGLAGSPHGATVGVAPGKPGLAADSRGAQSRAVAAGGGALPAENFSPPADVLAFTDGLGRLLAEAEMAWPHPTAAAAVLERAGHRVGGALGAALLVCAARFNEASGDFQAAAEQRFLAARLDETSRPAAVGLIRDIARLEPAAALAPLEELLGRFPASALARALARWGSSLARRAGDAAASWRFITRAHEAGPPADDARALARDRLDLAPAPLADPALLAALVEDHARAWPSSTAEVCRALRAAELAGTDAVLPEVIEGLERTLAGHAGAAAAGTSVTPGGFGDFGGHGASGASGASGGAVASAASAEAVVLGVAAERLADLAEDPALRARALILWKAADPARAVVAARALAEHLLAAESGAPPPSAGESIVDSALREAVRLDRTAPTFWLLSARARCRGDLADAARWLKHGADAWAASPLAPALFELAAELLACAAPPTPVRPLVMPPAMPSSAVAPVMSSAVPAEVGSASTSAAPGVGGEERSEESELGEIDAEVDAEIDTLFAKGRAQRGRSLATAATAERIFRQRARADRYAALLEHEHPTGAETPELMFEWRMARASALITVAWPVGADRGRADLDLDLDLDLDSGLGTARGQTQRAPDGGEPREVDHRGAAASTRVARAELVLQAFAIAPLHPVALGLLLGRWGRELAPRELARELMTAVVAAGDAAPEPWAAAAPAWAALAGERRRALDLAMSAVTSAVKSPVAPTVNSAEASGAGGRRAARTTSGVAAPSLEELRRFLASASAAELPGLLVQLVGEQDGVGQVSAAEAFERIGDVASAERWYRRAVASGASSEASAAVLADAQVALWRLGVAEAPLPRIQGADAATGTGERASAQRLAALAAAAIGQDRTALAARLAETPPHEESASPVVHQLAAQIDAAAGGKRASTFRKAALAVSQTAETPAGALLAADDLLGDARRLAPIALPGLASLARRLGDPRSAGLFLVEAARLLADALAGTGAVAPPSEERWLKEAQEIDPASLPARLAWRRHLVRTGRIWEAAQAAAREADLLRDRAHKVKALVRAAALASAALADLAPSFAGGPAEPPSKRDAGDRPDARTPNDRPEQAPSSEAARGEAPRLFLRRALEVAPDDVDAFARLRALLEQQSRHEELAELLSLRLGVTSNPFEATALRMARAELFAGPLADRAAAKAELRTVLEKEPQHARALARLADLESDDGEHAAAAELLIRRAWIERSPENLREIFLRLGRIYVRRIPDPKRAIGAYSRVLQLEPTNHEALDALSQLYVGLGENRNAAVITERLIQMEDHPERRAGYLVRLGHLAERSGDNFGAAAHFRRAVELAPRNLDAIWELARFLEKVRDGAGRRALLDRASEDLRLSVADTPGDRKLLSALVAVSRWRGRTVVAAAAAELLAAVTAAGPKPEPLPAWAAPPQDGRRLTALANAAVDERTFPPGVPPSVRQLLRSLGAPLMKGMKINLAALGIAGAARLAPGRTPRDLFDRVAADLGGGAYELFVVPADQATPSGPARLFIVPGDPPAVVMGAPVLQLGADAHRFAAGRMLRLATSHLDLLLAGTEADAGAWLSAMIRPFVPTYRHHSVPEELVAVRATRANRILSRRLRHEVMPYALESSGSLDLGSLRRGIRDGANRVGLLACGSVVAALRVLLTTAPPGAGELAARDSAEDGAEDGAEHGEKNGAPGGFASAVAENPEALTLLKFALSDEHDDLVRSLA